MLGWIFIFFRHSTNSFERKHFHPLIIICLRIQRALKYFLRKKYKPSLIYVSSVESFFIHAFINLKLNFPTIEQCSWNEKYKNIHSRWIEIWIARKFWSQCISFQNRVTISHFNKFSENCRSLNEEKSRNFVIKKLI